MRYELTWRATFGRPRLLRVGAHAGVADDADSHAGGEAGEAAREAGREVRVPLEQGVPHGVDCSKGVREGECVRTMRAGEGKAAKQASKDCSPRFYGKSLPMFKESARYIIGAVWPMSVVPGTLLVWGGKADFCADILLTPPKCTRQLLFRRTQLAKRFQYRMCSPVECSWHSWQKRGRVRKGRVGCALLVEMMTAMMRP